MKPQLLKPNIFCFNVRVVIVFEHSYPIPLTILCNFKSIINMVELAGGMSWSCFIVWTNHKFSISNVGILDLLWKKLKLSEIIVAFEDVKMLNMIIIKIC